MELLNTLKTKIVDEYGKNPIVTAFIIAMFAMLFISVVVALFTGGKTIAYMFLNDSTNIFMDHFNGLVIATDGPYTKHTSAYPALMTLIYEAYGEFARDFTTIFNPDVKLAFNMRDSQIPMMCFIVTALIIGWAFHKVLRKKFGSDIVRYEMVFVLLLVSYPILYAIERGNSIFLAILFSILYLCMYKSENKYIRILSYVCLGIAAGIKILPAILGILTLKHIGKKDFLYCVAIVSAILIVPFVFTDGSFFTMLDYAFNFTDIIAGRHGFINLTDYLAKFGLNGTAIIVIAFIVMALFLLSVLLDKRMKEWEEITIISVLIIVCFSFTAPYMFAYMLIPVYFFLAQEREMTTVNEIALVCFVAVFALIPAFDYDSAEISMIRSIGMMGLMVMLFALAIMRMAKSHDGIKDMVVTAFSDNKEYEVESKPAEEPESEAAPAEVERIQPPKTKKPVEVEKKSFFSKKKEEPKSKRNTNNKGKKKR